MNSTIGIGVVGLGARGVYLASAFDAFASARVVAVCDKDAHLIDVARQKLERPDLYGCTSLDDMLERDDVQAVICATHDHAHAAHGLAILNAGKHLFLEKPMAQTVGDCDALIEAWRQAQTVFMVGLELRYCSLCEDMKTIIERGDIGQIKLGYAVDNVSVGGQYYFHGLKRRKHFIGNLLLQKGTHSIDLMNWFIDSQPIRVYAEGGLDVFGGEAPDDKRCRDCQDRQTCAYNMTEQFILDYGEADWRREDLCVYAREIDVDDNAIVIVRYANGAKMSFTECHFTPDYNRHFTLIGDRGRICGFYNNEQDFRIEVTYRHSQRRDVILSEKREGGHGGSDPRIQAEFVNRILRGTPCCPGIIGARNSAAIAHAAGLSIERQQVVTIPACPLDSDSIQTSDTANSYG